MDPEKLRSCTTLNGGLLAIDGQLAHLNMEQIQNQITVPSHWILVVPFHVYGVCIPKSFNAPHGKSFYRSTALVSIA